MPQHQPLDKPLETIRAADYWRYGLGLKVTCRCGRQRTVAAGELAKFYGDEWRVGPAKLELIRPHLRCGNCGARWPQIALAVLD